MTGMSAVNGAHDPRFNSSQKMFPRSLKQEVQVTGKRRPVCVAHTGFPCILVSIRYPCFCWCCWFNREANTGFYLGSKASSIVPTAAPLTCVLGQSALPNSDQMPSRMTFCRINWEKGRSCMIKVTLGCPSSGQRVTNCSRGWNRVKMTCRMRFFQLMECNTSVSFQCAKMPVCWTGPLM